MTNGFKFGLSVASEPVSPAAPIIYSGNIYEIIEKCSKIGYDGVELQLRDPQKVDADKLLACCREHNMKITAIATGLEYSMNGLCMISDDEQNRLEMRRKLFADVELAEKLGCVVIIGCVRGNLPVTGDTKPYLDRFREELLLLSDKAAEHGVTIVLEAINFYVNNYLCSVRSVCDFLDELGRDNIKVHIDTHHMIIEESSVLDAVRYAGTRIGYVHFAENNRLYPGATNGQYYEILQILKKVGYPGWIVFEVCPKPDPDTCAIRGLEYVSSMAKLVDYHQITAAYM